MGKIVDGIYYNSENKPTHAGVVEVDGKLYYAEHDGVIFKDGKKVIHHGMANGLVGHGTYYFDKDGVIDLESFKRGEGNRKKKSKSKTNNSKLNKKDKQIIRIFSIIFVVVFGLFFGKKLFDVFVDKGGDTTVVVTNEFDIELPTYDEEVYLCTDSMIPFYRGESTILDIVNSGASAYRPFIFEYQIKNASSASFVLKENDKEVFACELDLKSNMLQIDNLIPNTSYNYVVIATDLEGQEHTNIGSFKTADTNRFIYLEGVYNTRDIGGYDTLYNKRVKYNMLIRGTELDGLVETKYYLKDVEDIKSFNFVCDFDLRNSDIFNTNYVSRLGDGVVHKFYNSPMYGGIFTKGNEYYLKAIFSDLADPNNYPMYLHCTYGADRTGTVIFLLQGLLGVSEEDMRNEYALTGFFSSSYASADFINPIISGLAGVRGDNINEKIENYMIDTIGISKEQVESIRSIFLD